MVVVLLVVFCRLESPTRVSGLREEVLEEADFDSIGLLARRDQKRIAEAHLDLDASWAELEQLVVKRALKGFIRVLYKVDL